MQFLERRFEKNNIENILANFFLEITSNKKNFFHPIETIKKFFSFNDTNNDEVFFRDFDSGFVDLYQKYNSLIINIYYKSLYYNNPENRYHEFINIINVVIGYTELLQINNKKFGKQYVHYLNVNKSDYAIIYNNHNKNNNEVKIILMLL